MIRRALLPICLSGLALIGGCSRADDDGVVDVAFIGSSEALFANGVRIGLGAQHLRAATTQGLVRLDEAGQVVPAIAERWIVTDDGTSYIFRIREFDLPDGERLTAQAVGDALRATLDRLDGTSMGLDLDVVRDVRAMTGRVVEIRLTTPMPGFLQLLAQPELGLALRGANIGPMVAEREDQRAVLTPLAPEARGLPIQPGWGETIQPVSVTATDAIAATQGFADGRYDLVTGGTIATLPLADTGPLSRGTIRLDSAIGLFGIDIRRPNGLLADPQRREALSMALDRAALIEPFNIAGWQATTRIVPSDLGGGDGSVAERWAELDLDERRAEASSRLANYLAANEGAASLALHLPEGPGSDVLFDALAGQWRTIGIDLRRSADIAGADLSLRDRVARYGGPRWFLNQFNCRVARRQCSADVDFLVDLATESPTIEEQRSYLVEAELAFAAYNSFIPIGAPIRWSLVRADVEGFAENPWGMHPLFPLSRAPI